jgi:hypothetical protein
MPKYFSLKTANTMIPDIERNMRRLIYLKESLVAVSSIIIEFEDDDEEAMNIVKSNKEFYRLFYEFYSSLEELYSRGVILSDLDLGLIEFYSTYQGRDIFLCWRLGEKEVKYWHELEEEYIDRKPIRELKAWRGH